MLSRLLFTAFYLVVDIIYVLISKTFYADVVKQIQNQPPRTSRKPFIMPISLLTYAIMGIGWFVLVAPVAELSSLRSTLSQALLVGLLMYGVFNGIMYVMFDAWSAMVAFRDLAWGLSWMSILSTLYWFYLRSRLHETKSSMS